jgi:hypothetical protein
MLRKKSTLMPVAGAAGRLGNDCTAAKKFAIMETWYLRGDRRPRPGPRMSLK